MEDTEKKDWECETQAQRDLTPLVQPSSALMGEEEREGGSQPNSPRWATLLDFTFNSYVYFQHRKSNGLPLEQVCFCFCHFQPVSDQTKNLNETETETFFRYQKFSIPNPILFSIPKFSETDTDTFFDNKNFQNRYRYFFLNLFFPKPIPILITIPFFSIPIIIIILIIIINF